VDGVMLARAGKRAPEPYCRLSGVCGAAQDQKTVFLMSCRDLEVLTIVVQNVRHAPLARLPENGWRSRPIVGRWEALQGVQFNGLPYPQSSTIDSGPEKRMFRAAQKTSRPRGSDGRGVAPASLVDEQSTGLFGEFCGLLRLV
jgi:hypothetical protein